MRILCSELIAESIQVASDGLTGGREIAARRGYIIPTIHPHAGRNKGIDITAERDDPVSARQILCGDTSWLVTNNVDAVGLERCYDGWRWLLVRFGAGRVSPKGQAALESHRVEIRRGENTLGGVMWAQEEDRACWSQCRLPDEKSTPMRPRQAV